MLWQLMLAASLVVLVAVFGGVLLLLARPWLKWLQPLLLCLAIGVLLGSAFLHLIPEALELSASSHPVMLAVLCGFLLFHGLEQGLHWHRHELPSSEERLP